MNVSSFQPKGLKYERLHFKIIGQFKSHLSSSLIDKECSEVGLSIPLSRQFQGGWGLDILWITSLRRVCLGDQRIHSQFGQYQEKLNSSIFLSLSLYQSLKLSLSRVQAQIFLCWSLFSCQSISKEVGNRSVVISKVIHLLSDSQ